MNLDGTRPNRTTRAESVDGSALSIFFGALLVFVAAFVAISRVAGVGVIALAPAYMFTPMLAGVVACLLRGVSLRSRGLRFDRSRRRWFVLAWIAPVPLLLVALALSVALPGVSFAADGDPLTLLGADPSAVDALSSGPVLFAVSIVAGLAAGATVNALFALGEEFGWRGYLLSELAPLGFWKASLAIGAVWGVWHAPIIVEGYNYPSHPVVGVGMMTLACVAFSPLYAYVTVKARSALAAAFLHGTFNGIGAILLVFTAGGSELVVNPVGLAGIAAFGLAALGIARAGAPTLDRDWAAGGAADAPEDGATDL